MAEPFILAVDSQQLSDFQSCEQSYYFNHVKMLETNQKRRGINKGSVLHKVYEDYYKGKLHKLNHKDAMFQAMQKLHTYALEAQLSEEDELLCLKKAGSYFQYHSNDLYEPLAVECGFTLPLYSDKDYLFLYEGRIDLIAIWKHNRRVIWVDHKNYLITSKPAFEVNQFYGYTWAISETFGEKAARQGLLDCTWMGASLAPEKSHEVFIGNFLPGQIENWKQNTIRTMMRMAKATQDSDYDFPQNPSYCHANKFGACKYVSVCHAGSPQAALYEINTKFKTREERWRAW